MPVAVGSRGAILMMFEDVMVVALWVMGDVHR